MRRNIDDIGPSWLIRRMIPERGFLIQTNLDEFWWATDFEAAEAGGDLYAPDFFSDGSGWWRSRDLVKSGRRELLEKFSISFQPRSLQWAEPQYEDFAKHFTEAKSEMSAGRLQKVVPVVFEEAECVDSPLPYFFRSLEKSNPHLFAYAFWDENGGVVGFTPEILFRGSAREIHLMALAGTRGKDQADSVSLLEDTKERDEHQVVIDHICEQLCEISNLQCSETRVHELPALMHLKTDISARAKTEFRFEDLVRLLHPTPALGGEPRRQAMKLLQSWDGGVSRGRFGAPFGIRSEGQWHVLVAIRSLQFDQQKWRLGSGCGVVSQSQLDSEWAELKRKRESVKSLLGLL